MQEISDPSIARAMRHAEAVCHQRNLAFTPLRRQVFELVCHHANPVGAYELLDELKSARGNAAPVTIYRALDFLIGAGLVHRVAALNAFTACHTLIAGHGGLLLVCGKCSNVIELEDPGVGERINESAAGVHFEASSELVEVRGTCEDCRVSRAG
jgi:Fur family transcriptional regulator, zinc uptake regulator